jgi:glycosyltransferase involved in cell wall biosynthesis
MRVIALMPVRNESWVLGQSLDCLSGFCDVVIVSDQSSEDDSREICRRFPKVIVLESSERRICEQARGELLDAARGYDGNNLLWCTDADELVSPRLARRLIDEPPDRLAAGTAIECDFYHLWGGVGRYRDDYTLYRPQRKLMAVVDDRRADYDRSPSLPLHQPRLARSPDSPILKSHVPVFHLQWLLANRNQVKQAWYRCREWMNGGRTAADINDQYSITLVPARVKTTPVPSTWVDGIAFPDLAIDDEPCWQERELLAWFDERGPAFFEPLEIWHVPSLRRAFRRRVGRGPKPDRSYLPPLAVRVGQLARRAVNAGRRQVGF